MNHVANRGQRAVLLGAATALAAIMAVPVATMAQDEMTDAMAQVRVLHGAGDAPAVDVYAGGNRIIEGLEYASITEYLEVPGGEYQIQVVPAGASLEEGPLVIDAPLTFDAGTMTTVAATGSLAAGINPQVLADDPSPSADGTQVRVVHFSFDAPAVDIAPDGDPALIEGLAYPDNTGYVDLPAGAYDLEIRAAGTDTVAFDIPEITLDAGTSYSVFAVGGFEDGSFTVVPAVDAALAGVRVGHFSPDAPPVDVYVNGNAVLPDVSFGVISGYLYVPAGTYTIEVVAAGADPADGAVIGPVDLTFDGGTLTTVAATNVLADITPVVTNDKPRPVADEAQIRVVHLSADAPAVDVAADGSKVQDAIFKKIKYGKATKYVTVPAGEYDLEVRPAGKKKAAYDIDPLTLEAGKSYSAMAIGQLGSDPSTFSVILVEDASVN
jgi:hypothetical protein